MSKIPENVENISKILKAEMTIGDNGVGTLTPDAFEKTLEGTDLDLEYFVKTQNHRDNVVAALGLATGELALDAFKKDDKLQQVSFELNVHKDKLNSAFNRTKQVPDGQGGMKTSYGSLSSKVQANGAANKGHLKKVKAHLAEQAKAILAG